MTFSPAWARTRTRAEFYLGVIDKVIPVDAAEREEALEWSKMPLDIKQKRFLYVELAVPGVQRSSRNLGELQAAIDSGIYFYNLYRSEGFSLSVLGSDAMLEFASTLVDAGGYIGGDLGAGEAQWFPTEDGDARGRAGHAASSAPPSSSHSTWPSESSARTPGPRSPARAVC